MTAGLQAGLGLIALALALIVSVAVIVSLRRTQRDIPLVSQAETTSSLLDSSHTNEAVLLVQSGGRVEYINDLAREWFEVRPGEFPDLERLIRRVRPAEEFIELCARQGQKRVSINGQLVEATSYQVPGPDLLMLVALRNIEFAKNVAGAGADSSILQLVTDFGTQVSANLKLEDALHAILLNISHLVPADYLEIKVWDEERQHFDAYVLEASGASSIQRASRSQFEGLTSLLVTQRKPILIPDLRIPPISLPDWNARSMVQSYLGVPLIVENRLLGALEFGHLSAGVLGQNDLDLVTLVSSQAAYGIRNALFYEAEQLHSAELAGLANLAQALGTSQDYTNLIGRLVESIRPLFDVDVLGFLLFDAGRSSLEAQSPFQGLPAHIVDIYRTTIPLNSPAEKTILSRSTILTRNAADDQTWRELGLQNLAQAASLRESVLEPLQVDDRLIGYFQVSNHKQPNIGFSQSELRLIKTVANQAVGIIDNSVLVEETRKRALRSDALRRIASLAASNVTPDEILKFSLGELTQLFKSDLAAIFLYDEQVGELRVHAGSVTGTSIDAAGTLARLHMDASQYRFTVSGSQKPFLSGRLSSRNHVAG
jgi:GAF domain-containing protein